MQLLWYNQKMQLLDIFLLSILQGVAEFLPISSSGHLVIFQHLLGVRIDGVRLDVCLHVGTLLSIVIYYRRSILSMLTGCFSKNCTASIRRQSWFFVLKLFISSLPAVIIYFLFAEEIKLLFENAKMVGALLMFTGAMLIGTRYLPTGAKDVSLLRALMMGVGQAMALLPGVSRSGMTLASAKGGGVSPEKAAEFSFLMSAPLICGALVLEIAAALGNGVSSIGQPTWPQLIFGMAIAAITGYVSLALLVKALKSKWFWIFGPYCLVMGLVTLLFI